MNGAVLLVHGDEPLRASARRALSAAGRPVGEAADIGTALKLAEELRPAVVVLPWLGPRLGRESLVELRGADATRGSRLIVWAEQAEISSAVAALELGADDCVRLPLEAAELVARVNASLRRPAAALEPGRLSAGPLVLDAALHRLLVKGREVPLSPTEFRLLKFLLENSRRVLSRDELLVNAWPRHIKAGGRTVDVHVRRLRRLLEPFGCDGMIQTVRSFGYRLACTDPVTHGEPPAGSVNRTRARL